MTRPNLVALVACLSLSLCAAAHGADRVVFGEFIGCGLGQGVLECRVMGEDGRDYYLSQDVGESGLPTNMDATVSQAVDPKAWRGMRLEIQGEIGPDGDFSKISRVRPAQVQPPSAERRLTPDVTLVGVIRETADGLFLDAGGKRYALSPGDGLRFGDIADLRKKSAGRPLKLGGDLLKDRDGLVFIVNGVLP